MTEPANLTRRSALRLFGLLGATAALSGVSVITRRFERVSARRPIIDARDFFRRPEIAAALGREYLRASPHESDVALLHDLIWDSFSNEELGIAHHGRRGIRQVLAARQHADFENGRVVSVGGWVLSVTEARLYGIAALSA
jgi:hypothetical protein